MRKEFFAIAALIAVTNGVIFDCDFTLECRVIIGDVYNCRPNVSNTGTRNLEAVTGSHLPGRSNNDVEYLYVYNQNLNRVPWISSNFSPISEALNGLTQTY